MTKKNFLNSTAVTVLTAAALLFTASESFAWEIERKEEVGVDKARKVLASENASDAEQMKAGPGQEEAEKTKVRAVAKKQNR